MSLYLQFFAKRTARLSLQRQVDSLKQEEDDLMYQIMKEMDSQNIFTTDIDGLHVVRTRKIASNVVSWPDLLDHIRTTGSLDLLQKRVTESAVKLRWDSGAQIPGVEQTFKDSLTIASNG